MSDCIIRNYERINVSDHLGRQPWAQGTHLILGHNTCPSALKVTIVFGVAVPLIAFTFLPEPQETTSYKRLIKAASEMPCAQTMGGTP